MALAERYGAGTGVRDQVFVSLGYCIGSALMNGSLYAGIGIRRGNRLCDESLTGACAAPAEITTA